MADPGSIEVQFELGCALAALGDNCGAHGLTVSRTECFLGGVMALAGD
jgi:hypothetical protein